jgi:hypothetical protein
MKQIIILATAVFILLVTQSYSQISNTTNINDISLTEYVGWNGSLTSPSGAKDVDIKNLYQNKDIKFYTETEQV